MSAAGRGRARTPFRCGSPSPGPELLCPPSPPSSGAAERLAGPLLPPAGASWKVSHRAASDGRIRAELAAWPRPLAPRRGLSPDSAGANTSGSHKPAGGCLVLPRQPQRTAGWADATPRGGGLRGPGQGGGRKLTAHVALPGVSRWPSAATLAPHSVCVCECLPPPTVSSSGGQATHVWCIHL